MSREALAPTNPVSSSGDVTKCFRMYGSDRNMTRLCQASHVWWQRFEEESGSALFTPCGLLAFGADQQRSLAHWRDPRAARFAQESVPVMEREGVLHEFVMRTPRT
jgi:glycine/D-amino acid oxidase-like deaminating enzyme